MKISDPEIRNIRNIRNIKIYQGRSLKWSKKEKWNQILVEPVLYCIFINLIINKFSIFFEDLKKQRENQNSLKEKEI